MSLRIKFIQLLIQINESLIFYPRLAAYYKRVITIKNPVILDVGANKGQSIRFFLKLFPGATIIAFEPNYKLYKKLIYKYGSMHNLQLVNKGVSNQNGKLLLKETVTDETSTFEELNYKSEYLKMKSKVLGIKPEHLVLDTYEVEVIKLSDFIVQQQLKQINVLKIDTEGHELKCLEGLFLGEPLSVNFIQLEHHHDDMYINAVGDNEIRSFLQKNGFEQHQKIKHGFGDFDELLFKSTSS
jgi:FkbM family methyltransferase